MMITINKLEDAHIIENVFVFGNSVSDEKHILLKPHANGDDVLAKMERNVIDFPGEYDINQKYIKAMATKENKLNYFVKYANKSFAIIQSAKVLDLDDLINVQYRIFTDEKVLKKLEQLELEGEKIPLYESDTIE